MRQTGHRLVVNRLCRRGGNHLRQRQDCAKHERFHGSVQKNNSRLVHHDFASLRWMSTAPLSNSESLEAEHDQLKSSSLSKRMKAARALRNVSLQSVQSWLRREPRWFDETIKSLNLSSTSRWTAGPSKEGLQAIFGGLPDQERESTSSSSAHLPDEIMGKYRKMYEDGFVSYMQALRESPPPAIEAALDRLVDVGFGDQEWAGKFRSIHEVARARKQIEEQIMVKTNEYKRRLKQVKELREEGSKMKEQLKQAQKGLRYSDQITRLKDMIEKSDRNTLSHEHGCNRIKSSIDKLRMKLESMALPLIETETDDVNKVVNDVMHVICDHYADYIQQRNSKLIEHYQTLDIQTDLTKPHEWFLLARFDKRKIIYHGGPTNSGKTYSALERLKQAKSGLYLGPLRLLAAEIYETLNYHGIYTSLITGQDKRDVPFATHAAATMEIAQTQNHKEFDVVVIDEIQMIADKDRGHAWTRALMGMRCKEIHVCGGLEAYDIVRKIAEACGDDLELNSYKRFSELIVAKRSLARGQDRRNSYRSVQPGDCIVAFSRNDIFAIKREIEKNTKHKCCVIYGSLPPETRTSQAKLFNDPNSGFDILVASDAIGMGLNLNIRRIIFNSLFKNDGKGIVRLDHSSVKQIAGRAGRRNSPFPEGEVTCRDPRDLAYIRECLNTEIETIEKAGLLPTPGHIEKFNLAVQGNDDSERLKHLHILLRDFSEMAVLKGDYFLCRQSSMYVIAKWLSEIPLSIKDKYTFCMSPISTNNSAGKDVILKFAHKMAAGEVPGVSTSSIPRRARNFDHIANLCGIYSEVELFLWLQNKFPPINVMEEQQALARKELVTNFISLGLKEAEKLKLDHCYVRRDIRQREKWKKSNNDDSESNTSQNFVVVREGKANSSRKRNTIGHRQYSASTQRGKR